VAWVGAFSSLFAAIIALTQTDIKRVLAFSTMSQIGYMMLALGVSGYYGHEGLGYMASMFHLFTHAMFKALLFLAAGSVIHAVHSNNLLEMGGLRKYLPITHITFLIAALSIAGFPGFAGFFSKDEILVATYEHSKLLYAMGITVALLTAFYMFRLYFGIFWNQNREYKHTPHESPLAMTLPLMIFAFLSIATGYIHFSQFVTADLKAFEAHLNYPLAAIAVGMALTGISIALVFYKKQTDLPNKISNALGSLYVWAYHKFYIDELYLFVTKEIIFKRISTPFAWFDKHVVDGTMNLIGNSTVTGSEKIKGLQSGRIQDYAFAFLGGLIILVIIVVYNFM
jgi:NADH-quinone oxidoreductase subunit L